MVDDRDEEAFTYTYTIITIIIIIISTDQNLTLARFEEAVPSRAKKRGAKSGREHEENMPVSTRDGNSIYIPISFGGISSGVKFMGG